MSRVCYDYVGLRHGLHHPSPCQNPLLLSYPGLDLRIAFSPFELLFQLGSGHPKALFELLPLIEIVERRKSEKSRSNFESKLKGNPCDRPSRCK